MDRNESFPALSVSAVSIRLAWASLEIVSDDVQAIELSISGSEQEATALRVSLTDGLLEAEQPMHGISAANVMTGHWLTVYVRVPRSWKGSVDLSTGSGRLTARGLNGSDLTLSTSSGRLLASQLSFITVSAGVMNTEPELSGITCEKLSIRSLNGDVRVKDSSAAVLKLTTVNGDLSVSLREAFTSVSASTVNGSLILEAPVDAVNVKRKAVAGQIRTFNVALAEDAPVVNMKCVNGDLEITGTPETKTL